MPRFPLFCRGDLLLVAAVVCWGGFGPLGLQAAQVVRPVSGFVAGFQGNPRGIGLQPDGHILVIGDLQVGEPPEDRHLIRLHPNGQFDPSYEDPGISLGPYSQVAFAVDSQGRALLVRQSATPTVVRLLPDGHADLSWKEQVRFEPREGGTTEIHCLVPLRNGSLLVGGAFSLAGGVPRQCVARLTPDGELDPTFNAENSLVPGTDEFFQPVVRAATEDGGGNLWIGGSFTPGGGFGENLVVVRAADGEVLRIPLNVPNILAAAPSAGVASEYAVALPNGSSVGLCSLLSASPRPRLYAGAALPGKQDMLVAGDVGGVTGYWIQPFRQPPFACAELCTLGFKQTVPSSHILPLDATRFLAVGNFDSRAYFLDYLGGNPKGIDRLPNGNLIVCDSENRNGSVVEYDRNGNIIRLWEFPILGDPQGIAYDPQRDRFYMLDNDFEALFVFDGEARFVRALDIRSLGIDEPEGIEVHPVTGNLLVVDDQVNRLFEMTDEGELLGSVSLAAAAAERGLTALGAEGLASDAKHDRLFISFDEGNWVGTFRFTPSDSPGGPRLSLLSYFRGAGGVLKRGGDGIAYDPETDRLWMVCSKWNRIAEMRLDGQPVQQDSFSPGLAMFELVSVAPKPGSRFLGWLLDGDTLEVELELEPLKYFSLEATTELPLAGEVTKLQTVAGSLAPRKVRVGLNPDEPVQFFRISEQP